MMQRVVAATYDTQLYSTRSADGHTFVLTRRYPYQVIRYWLTIDVTYAASGSFVSTATSGTSITYTIEGDWGMQRIRLIPWALMLAALALFAFMLSPLLIPIEIAALLVVALVGVFVFVVYALRQDYNAKLTDLDFYVSGLVQK
ncbi:MAG: hypothetical protein HC828_22050 [Blastochloris sp.]|nr:hypothetical protein [Blastochloris sp.]